MDFKTGIANVVFGEEIDPERAAREEGLLRALIGWINNTARERVAEFSRSVDEVVVPTLSAPNVLRLGQLLQARCPEVLSNMPKLNAHLSVLDVANRAGKFFSLANLESLRKALAEEGDS
jgi:hypothetical protein